MLTRRTKTEKERKRGDQNSLDSDRVRKGARGAAHEAPPGRSSADRHAVRSGMDRLVPPVILQADPLGAFRALVRLGTRSN